MKRAWSTWSAGLLPRKDDRHAHAAACLARCDGRGHEPGRAVVYPLVRAASTFSGVAARRGDATQVRRLKRIGPGNGVDATRSPIRLPRSHSTTLQRVPNVTCASGTGRLTMALRT